MADVYDRLITAQRDSLRGDFAGAKAQMRIVVEAVQRDDMGNPLTATGREEGSPPGSPAFPVHILGRAEVEEREVILAEYEKGNPAAATLTYAGHIATTLAGAGAARLQVGPTPAFVAGSGWYATDVQNVSGAVASYITIFFLPVPLKYRASYYIISYRIGSGEWADTIVPGPGDGTMEARLPRSFPAGVTVDVKLRAVYAISYNPSLESEVKSLVTAADTASPGTATGCAVDNTVAGRLLLRAQGAVDLDRFDSWRYEVANDGAGTGLVTVQLPGQYDHIGAAGPKYVAVRPVSKSGVLGTRWPSPTGFSGPYTLTPAADPLDTTAPPQWGAPTLATRVNTPAGGGGQGFIKVTFPAYSFPADYDYTVVRLVGPSADSEQRVIYAGSPPSPQEYQVDFGSWTVTLYGVDKAGNRSTVSPSAAASVADPGLPAGAGDVTTTSVSLGVRVVWATVARALWYRVWRATSSGGAGAAVIAERVDGDRYVDAQAASGLSAGTVYYYKVEARNEAGGGALSPTWAAGTVGAYDGANVAVNSLEANVLKATTTVTSLLRTAASGRRWEVEGATGSGTEMQIRAYDTAVLRWILNYSGLTFYTDTGSIRGLLTKDGIQVNNDSGAVRNSITGSGMTIYYDSGRERMAVNTNGLYIYRDVVGSPVRVQLDDNGLTVRDNSNIPWFTADPTAGVSGFFDNSHPFKLTNAQGGGSDLILSGKTINGVASHYLTMLSSIPLYIGGDAVGATATGPWVQITPSGQVQFGTGTAVADVGLDQTVDRFGNAWTLRLVGNSGGSNNGNFVAADYHSIRNSNAVQGIIWLGNGSGGDRYLLYNGTNYVMPGAQAIINGVTVGSAASTKDDIAEAEIDVDRFLRLRPKRYKLRSEREGDRAKGKDRRKHRLGFVAEEVAETIPEVSVDLSDCLDHDGKPAFGGLGYSLEGMVAALHAVIASQANQIKALTGRLEKLEAR